MTLSSASASGCGRGLTAGINAHHLQTEIGELVEDAVQLVLVGEIPGQRGRSRPRFERELMEGPIKAGCDPAAHDDLVPADGRARGSFHGATLTAGGVTRHHP